VKFDNDRFMSRAERVDLILPRVPFRAAAFGGVCPGFWVIASREVAVNRCLSFGTLFKAAFLEARVVMGAWGCFLLRR
jgi:hypothetical protein